MSRQTAETEEQELAALEAKCALLSRQLHEANAAQRCTADRLTALRKKHRRAFRSFKQSADHWERSCGVSRGTSPERSSDGSHNRPSDTDGRGPSDAAPSDDEGKRGRDVVSPTPPRREDSEMPVPIGEPHQHRPEEPVGGGFSQ